MLEKYLSNILVPYLSRYAENIDAKQLHIDLWSGNVSLKDLVLKPSLLDTLLQMDSGSNSDPAAVPAAASGTSRRLPVTLQRGICRKVNIVVPFTHLRSKPVVIEVGELFICVRGNTGDLDVVLSKAAKLDAQAACKAWELEQFEEERRRMKECASNNTTAGTSGASSGGVGGGGNNNLSTDAVDAASGIAGMVSTSGLSSAPSPSGEKSGFITRLGELVINNIVVKIQSVHIRYEDESTRTVMGAILGGVQLHTIDSATGMAKFVDPSSLQRISKRLEFSGLQFYCDDPTRHDVNSRNHFISNITDVSSWCTAMRDRVEAGDVEKSTVLGPVKGEVDANLVLKRFVKDLLHTPYLALRMKLESVISKFNRAQYVSFIRTVSLLSNWMELTEVLSRRPKIPVIGHARLWWRYAIHAVRAIAGAPRRERLLQRISEVCVVDYHVLYRDVVRKAEMSAEKQRAYRFITRFMTVPDMIAGRKYVYTQIANAIQLKRKDNEAKKAEAQSNFEKKNTGWFSWLRREQKTPQAMEEEELAFIELERSYGIDVNNPDETGTTIADVMKFPKSYCWLDVQFDVPMLSANAHLSKMETATLMLHHVGVRFKKFNAPNSVHFRFLTENLTLSNPVQNDSLLENLPTLVEGLPLPSFMHSDRKSSLMLPSVSSSSSLQMCSTPLLECSVALNPVEQPLQDTHLDLMLDLRLLPLRVVADPPTIETITRFFKFPPGLDLAAILDSTKHFAVTVGQAASAELRLAMAHSKSFKISVDAAAPYIILPKTLRGSVAEPALAVSLGHVKFDTQPLTDTEKQQRLATKQPDDANEEMLYYSSTATFANFYVELAPIEMTLEKPGTGFMLVPEVAFSAAVLQRIDDTTDSREWLIVRIEVPALCMACSVSQAYILSSMVESWMMYSNANEPALADHEEVELLEVAQVHEVGRRTSLYGVGPLEGTYMISCLGPTRVRTRKVTEPEVEDSNTVTPLSNAKVLEDLPYVRLHVRLQELGIVIFEDDPDRQRPLVTPRFTLAFSTASVTLHMRTVQREVEMMLEHLYCRDAMDPEHLILSAALTRCTVKTALNAPARIDVVLEPSLKFRFGTPCIQLLEALMDIINLVSTAPDVVQLQPHHHQHQQIDGGFGGGEDENSVTMFSQVSLCNVCGTSSAKASTTHAISEQALQIKLVEELCATHDTHVAHLSLHIAGTTTVELMDRRPGMSEDYPFAYASFTEVSLFLKKNRVTLEVGGGVREVTLALSDAHDVSPSNRVIMKHKALPPLPSSSVQSMTAQDDLAVDVVSSRYYSNEHVSFAYRTSRPVMPIFETCSGGKRQLMNATELCFSSFVEVEVSSSAVLLDMHSILTMTQYFSSGLFANVAKLPNRPRYDGRVAVFTPSPQPPQLLTSVRVYARDLVFILPVDARISSSEHFQVSVDHVVVQSSLLSAEGRQSMNISLREIRLLRHFSPGGTASMTLGIGEEEGVQQHVLMPTTTLDVSVKTPLDPISDEPLRVDLRGDELSLAITENDIVELCRLAGGNLTRSPPAPAPASSSKFPTTTATMAESSLMDSMKNNNTLREVHVAWRVTTVCVSLLDQVSGNQRFRVEGNALLAQLIAPGGDMNVRWKRLELYDVHEETCCATMLLSGESSIELCNILTSRGILQRSFDAQEMTTGDGHDVILCDTVDSELLSIEGRLTPRMMSSSLLPGLEQQQEQQEEQQQEQQQQQQQQSCAGGKMELLEVPTLVVDFTLKRFAISDQWLAVYDFLCNEAVMDALQPMMSGAASSTKLCGSCDSAGEGADEKKRFRCLVKTRGVNVPFLTTTRKEFIEADITSLIVDVVCLSNTTTVTVRMQDLLVRHCASGENILFKRQDATDAQGETGDADIQLLSNVTDMSVSTNAATGVADPIFGGDILTIWCLLDAGRERQEVTITLGQLSALVSIPLITQLVAYCTDSDQPIAKISNLGVMRERREWLARTAKNMVDKGVVSLNLLWRQPRIILAGDARELANKSRNIEAHLGVMRSTVCLDKRDGKCSVATVVSDFAIPDMLEKSSLRLSCTFGKRKRNISVMMDKAIALLHPEEVEKLLWVLQRNLMAPEGLVDEVINVLPSQPKQEEEQQQEKKEEVMAGEGAAPLTVRFQASSIVVAMHDVLGINAHTASLNGIKLELAPTGDMRMAVCSLGMVEHFTNRQLLQSLSDKTITLHISAEKKSTYLTLVDLNFLLIPKALGSLLNMLLSIQFPPQPTQTGTTGETPEVSTASMTTQVSNRCVCVSLNRCRTVAVQGDHDVFAAELKDSVVEWRAYADASSMVSASIGWISVQDAFSATTRYPEILRPMRKREADTEGCKPPGVIEFSLTTRPPKKESGPTTTPSFAHQMRLHVSSLAIVLVPEVTSAIMQVLAEVKEHISDVNREKAYDYVADKTTQTVHERQELMQVEITLDRPSITLAESASTANVIEVFPGDFVVWNELCSMQGDLRTPHDDTCSEVFRVCISRMSLNVLGVSALSHDKSFEVSLSRSCGESPAPASTTTTSTTAVDTACITLIMPAMSVMLTQNQLVYIMDVVGAFKYSTSAAAHSDVALFIASTTSQGVSGCHQEVFANTISCPTPIANSIPVGHTGRRRAWSSPLPPQHSNITTASPVMDETQSSGINGGGGGGESLMTFTAKLQCIEANIDDIFRIGMSDLNITHSEKTCSGGGNNNTTTTVALNAIVVQHYVKGSGSMKTNLFVMEEANIVSKSTSKLTSNTRATETKMEVSFNSMQIALSPLMVKDTRNVLYGPFCTKVLRIPIVPIPVCILSTEMHVLDSDLHLDNNHILITGCKERCSYVLDLNQHRLCLSGEPSAQLVLSENCQLTIVNGTIVVPGLYTLSSFVSFGFNATLFTGESCSIEKVAHYDRTPPLWVRPIRRRSRAGMDSSCTSQCKSTLPSPIVVPKPHLTQRLLSPLSSTAATGSPFILGSQGVEEENWTIVSLYSKDVTLQVMSEEVEAVGVTLNMSVDFLYSQQMENGTLMQRASNLCLKDVCTNEQNETTLLPTTLKVSVTGTETLCIAAEMGSLGLCLQIGLLRSMLDLGKDFMSSFGGEESVQLCLPQVTLESDEFLPLMLVPKAGECRICGGANALVGESPDASGVFCYHCCTGRVDSPATDVRFEVASVDVVLLGENNMMLQLYTPSGILASMAPQRVFQIQLNLQVRNLNQIAGVWEPLVERLEAQIGGNISSSSYWVKVERLDYILSPENLKILSRLAREFAVTSTLQKKFHSRSRKCVCRTPHDAVKVQLDDDKPFCMMAPPPSPPRDVQRGADSAGPSLLSASGSSSLLPPASSAVDGNLEGIYAFVVVENYFDGVLEFDGKSVGPRGGRLESDTKSRCGVLRQPNSTSETRIDFVKSPLFVCEGDMVVEVRILTSCDVDSCCVQRKVHIRCFPVHSTGMIICVENKLRASLEVIRGSPVVTWQERFYFHSGFPLDEKLHLRPVKNTNGGVEGEEEYTVATIARTREVPTLRALLNASSTTLVCRSSKNHNQAFIMKVIERQDEMRAGKFTFVLAIEPKIRIQSYLPYILLLSASTSGSKRQKDEYSAVVEPAQCVDVDLGEAGVEDVLFHIEVRQQGGPRGDVGYCTPQRVSLSHNSVDVVLTGGLKHVQEMRFQARCRGNVITLSTPYCIVNFTPLELHVRESNASGELKSKGSTNYVFLPSEMQKAYAASPSVPDANEFFVNMSTGGFHARAVPFHVQDRGVILLEDKTQDKSRSEKKKHSALHLVYLTQVDMYGSRFVTIVPRWTIVNRTSRPLYVAQAIRAPCGSSSAQSSPLTATTTSTSGSSRGSGQRKSVGDAVSASGKMSEQWLPCRGDLALLASPNTATPFLSTVECNAKLGYNVFVLQERNAPVYGNPVSLEEIGCTQVVAHGMSSVLDTHGVNIIVDTSVIMDGPYTFVTLQDPIVAPYILLNRTLTPLELHDTHGRLLVQCKPGCSTPFVMNSSNGTNRTRVCILNESPSDFPTGTAASKRGKREQLDLFAEFNFHEPITSEEILNPLGVEYTITLGPFGQHIVAITPANSGAMQPGQMYQPAPPAPIDVVVNLSLVSVSVVTMDSDLLFGSILDTRVHFKRKDRKEVMQFSVKKFQIDNQTEEKPVFEVCLAAIPASTSLAFVAGYVERTVVPAKALLYVDEVRLDVTPVALRLSDNVLVAVTTFAAQLTAEEPMRQTAPTGRELFETAPLHVGVMNTRVIVDRMVVNPLVVRLWFEREVDTHDFIREQMRHRTAALVSMMVRSCENVRVSMPGIIMQKRKSNVGLMLQWIIQAYLDGIRHEIHGLLFQYASSLPLLGAPIKIASGVGSGAMKFFQEPIADLTTSPKAFALGLANASSALVAEVVGGGLSAVSNLAKTGAGIMGVVSSDRERKRTNLLRGIASGVTGVVTKPMEGAAESGAAGLVRGVGMGLLGVVASPVAGLLSDVSKMTNTAAQLCDDTYVPMAYRVRRPREFHPSGAVAEYQALLSVFEYDRGEPSGWCWKSESFLPTDGARWYPSSKEQIERSHGVPSSRWQLGFYKTNFEGWKFSNKFYGVYDREQVPTARVRRRRWVALLKSPPVSHVVQLVGQCSTDPFNPSSSCSVAKAAVDPVAVATSEATVTSFSPVLQDSRTVSVSVPTTFLDVETKWEKGGVPGQERQQGKGAFSQVDSDIVELYEYESRLPLIGWSSRFLPAGCPPWGDREGRAMPRKSGVPLPNGWAWDSDWTVVTDSHSDADGWERVQTWKESGAKVRRRRWRRTMRKIH